MILNVSQDTMAVTAQDSLRQKCHHDYDEQNPEEPILMGLISPTHQPLYSSGTSTKGLIWCLDSPSDSRNNTGSESLCTTHTDTSYQGANTDVHHHRLPAPAGCGVEDQDE